MIPVARPWMDEREADAARRVILSGWVTQGPEVASFERGFAEAVGAAHACAVSSCTTALHLALSALGVGPGDEVVTVSHSFIATANAIRYCGAVPVFVDIDASTFNMDPTLVDAAISTRTKALLVVHQLGMPCDLSRLMAIARRRGVPVVEDAACAVGSEIRWDDVWERIGRPHGDVACFSFHPRKLLSTGDGGMLTTSRSDLDARFRLLRQHGMSVPDTVRHTSTQVVFEDYPVVGFNYRMTDIQAAIGREQLKRLSLMVARRRALAARYAEHLGGVAGVTIPHEPTWARSNWQSYAVTLDAGLGAGLRADSVQRAIMQRMLDAGVSTRRGAMNVHREGAYPPGSWRAAGSLVRSEHAQATTVVLPLYHQMTDEDQNRVVEALRSAIDA
ncbi:MAG: DegT/DnrJ/EryC1/StrS family aminotransferase [Vicinamibacterales bacterium]